MLIGISSPYRKTGLLYQKHRDHFGQDSDDVLVVQAPSRVFNPTLDEQIIAAAISADPEAAITEWEGEFRSDISSFLGDATIEAAVDYSQPLEIPPRSGISYRAFVDASGGRHDAYCIAVSHKEKDNFIIDVIRGATPPFDPQNVTEQFAALLKEYHVSEVVGDNFAAEWVQNAWTKCGIRYRRSDKPKSQLYLECLPLFTRGLVSLPDHAKLLRELRLLERHTHRSGKDTVDHGRNGSDDYANSVCGVLAGLSLQSNYAEAIGRAFALTDDDQTENRRSLADRNLAQVYNTIARGVRPV